MNDFMDDLDDELDDSTSKKVIRFLIKHGIFLIAVVAIVISVAMGMFLHSARVREEKLEAQVGNLQDMYNILKESHEEISDATKKSVPIITSTLIKDELSTLAELVTQEYIYTNSDRSEEDKPWIFGWNQPFGAKSILITYDGTIKAGINLNETSIDIDEEKHTIKIVLPQSKITSNEIPVESLIVLEAKDGLFNKVEFNDYGEFIEQQKLVMEQKAIDRGLLEKANKEAVSIIKGFLSGMTEAGGYKLEVSTQE